MPSYHPFHNHRDIIPSNANVVGIGKPSKYFAFPVASFGSELAVTLNRARRESPERRKIERIMVSNAVLRPRVYATAVGATPKEIYLSTD